MSASQSSQSKDQILWTVTTVLDSVAMTWNTKWFRIQRTFRLSLPSDATTRLFLVSSGDETPYNHLFTLEEFKDVLKSCKNGALGPDGISYQMINPTHQLRYFM